MKKSILTLIMGVSCCFTSHFSNAQNPLSTKVQTEFGIGISFPTLNSGKELIRAENLRKEGLSYYQNPGVSSKNVGAYGRLIGWSMATSYYHPLKKIKGLMLGTAFRLSLTGSQPSTGGYEEGYFFNFVSVGTGLKYYPFERNNFFIKGDVGLASVFTKNRYLNNLNEQNFHHQFGVGINFSLATGYSFTPFIQKTKTIDLQAILQQSNTRVEVNGIGDDPWSYGAINFMLSMNF